MDDQIDALEEEALEYGNEFELGMEDLEKLEQLFLKMTENAEKDEQESLIVTFARCVGEIVRTSYGGQWNLSYDDPKNVYFNTPVITGHSEIPGLEFFRCLQYERYS